MLAGCELWTRDDQFRGSDVNLTELQVDVLRYDGNGQVNVDNPTCQQS